MAWPAKSWPVRKSGLQGSKFAVQSYANNALYSTGGATGLNTGYLQQEANGEVVAVRLCIASKVIAGGTPPTFKAVVATSDTSGSTVNDVWSPTVGGVQYKALADAQGRGWVPVTFNNDQPNITMPFAVGSNATSYNAVIRSDRIVLPSRQRKGGEFGGPMFLARIENTNAAAQFTVMAGVSFTDYAALFGSRGIDVFRTSRAANQGVSDLTLAPTDISSAYGHPVWFEFEYAAPHIAFGIGGDSRYGGGGHPSITYISWMQRALRAASFGLPINMCNLAGSSHNSTSYIALVDNFLNAGGSLTHLVIPAHTPNDGINSIAGADAAIAGLTAAIARWRARGIKIILSTGYACGYNGNAEIARQYCITWAKNFCATGAAILFNTDAIISDTTTTPGTGVIKAAYFFTGDNIHCNSAGCEDMAALLIPLISANM